jgi:hypothetical protein
MVRSGSEQNTFKLQIYLDYFTKIKDIIVTPTIIANLSCGILMSNQHFAELVEPLLGLNNDTVIITQKYNCSKDE